MSAIQGFDDGTEAERGDEPKLRQRPPAAETKKRGRSGSSAAQAATSDDPDDHGESSMEGCEDLVAEPPPCLFKGYSFTADNPPETKYDFAQVPLCESGLPDSVLLRPSNRRQWFVCLKELESLAKESLDRRATRLQLRPPSGLPLVYIADRMDIDDPLWGYQIRCSKTGWLQGFITLTTFTTWTHYFEWDSLNPASGMPAARVANSLSGRPDPAMEVLEGDETVHQVAQRVGVRAADIVHWNSSRYTSIHANSRVIAGTELFIMDPVQADRTAVERKGETPRALAARLGVETEDLLLLNSASHPSLSATSKLKPGMELQYRDRSAEPEVFLPTDAPKRALDLDGELARQLQEQRRFGDPTTTGVVWPRVAEIGLLAGLGCGKLLVKLALEELAMSSEFDFVVLQATMASVSFYEEMGFARVGAVARYAASGESTPLDALPLQGYRHWASADESQLEQFGEVSYMMALKLSTWQAAKKSKASKMLGKRLVREWPEVQSCQIRTGSKKGGASSVNAAGIVGGSAVQVGDMTLNVAEGDDARLQLRYEVERVLDSRNEDGNLQYLVKWKHCQLTDATWEDASSSMLKSEPAKQALIRFRKHQHRSSTGMASPLASPGSARKRPVGNWDAPAPVPSPAWAKKIVRVYQPEVPTPSASSPRIFHGGLGEPPKPVRSPVGAASESSDVPDKERLEREHRYWWISRFVVSTHKCTVLPLIAAGRFGGCGRRAGRVRWRVAPEKRGFEREVSASLLQLVSAESVTGAREPEGEAWAIDEADVEHAAREQAAAARNKRRRDLDSGEDPASLGLSPLSAAVAVAPPAKRRGRSTGEPRRSSGDGMAPVRKKKRLAPASRTCLACTKGKHTAHTCGVRGKSLVCVPVASDAAVAAT